MNPYARELTDPAPELDAGTLRQAKATASSLASGGSVVGSISQKLKTQGIDPLNAERIATDAVIARSRIERVMGLCIAGLGAVLFLAGISLVLLVGRRLGIYVVMSGLFLVMLGMIKVFHQSKLSRSQPGAERIR